MLLLGLTRSRQALWRPSALLVVIALSVLGHVGAAHAQADITLGEVLPVLADGPFAEVVVAKAPRPGAVRIVRRREIKRVLEHHGLESEGLEIPARTRIMRRSRRVPGAQLRAALTQAVEAVVGRCEIVGLRPPPSVTVSTRVPRFVAEPPRTLLRSGHRSIAVRGGAGGSRVIVSVRLECPPPVIAANASVRIVVRVASVVASAPGRARQPGGVGDVIRVINTATGTGLVARVVNGDTVEVVR